MAPLSSPSSSASLTALTEAAAAVTSTLDLDEVLATIAELARAVTRAEASSVFSRDPHKGQLKVAAATGHWREAMIGRAFDAHLGIPGQVLQNEAPVMLADVRASSRFCKEIDELSSTRTRSLLAAPMIHRSEVIGVIEVVNRRDEQAFTQEDLKVLQIFAVFAATAIHNARTHADLKQQVSALRESVLKRTPIIGQSPLLKQVLELCSRVAGSPTTVLLLGETGTGKEVTARHIHNLSRRRDETFVAVNCAAIPETLLETELFGHEKGAFTGAQAQRRGWFEVAGRGTLFLDEIGEISRAMQAKLLRVLQEKRLVRVGGTQPIPCDTRIIAATNRNLKNMMIDGLFREDLYYRLSVFPIQLPALRERREDIPLFVEHFVHKAAKECNIRELRVSPATMKALTDYPWPGNIRELQNVVERAVLMSDGEMLLPRHLPPEIEASAAAVDGRAMEASTLHGQERALVLRALEENNWNQSQAAKVLGITRYHVRHRIKKYGLQRPSARSMDG
ncbi:MAG: sigma 54-interacting transcriptional regulator [Planctomycetes bacterium]|nr:sigma 54-interacting transcriptional regulator [Planctomycetota bacterium]